MEQTNELRMWKNETKTKTKTYYVTFPCALFFDLAHKQCNGVIKGWLHCLTSESKGRFLVNNILMFGSAWCLVTAQIQFSLIKKIKIGRPEHSLTPHPQRPITSHFCLKSRPSSKWMSYMCIIPNKDSLRGRKILI